MKKRMLAILLTAFITISVFSIPIFAEENDESETQAEWPTSFSDVQEGAWYYDSVKFVSEKQIFAGTGNGMFSPNSSLTRAMLVAIMYRYAGSPAVEGDVSFSDIDRNAYYYQSLIWGVQNHIIAGLSDKIFQPNTAITRQDVTAILSRYAAYCGNTINGWLDLYDFADGGNVTQYAKAPMQWAYSYKIIVGRSATSLEPKGTATRAECAKLIHYFDGVNLSEVPTAVPSLFHGNHTVTYDAMCEYLNTMQKIYPNLIGVSSAGKSAEGRDIKLVSIGTGSRYIYMQGNLHGREYLSLNYLLEVLDSYAYAYATNSGFDGYDVRSMLSNFKIIMMPCANPDGQNIAINGYNAAANPSAVAAMYNPKGSHDYWKANAQGVDLNRNFPVAWTPGLVKRPANAEYGGLYAASAIETQNILNVFNSYPFETVLDCHTAGNLIYYFDSACSAQYIARAKVLATALSASSGYKMSDETTVGPGAANYVRNAYGVPGLTVELYPTASYPLNSSLFTSAVWGKAKDIPLVIIKYLMEN